MPETLGLLGGGSQADEIEAYARPDVVAFRAVQAEFLAATSPDTVDVATTDERWLALPVVAAVGAPGLRRELVEAWGGDRFRTIVAASAWVDPSARLGMGVVIAPQAAVSVNAAIGAHALLNLGATVSHDSVVGAFVTISPGVHIAGRCVIGDGAFLGIGASVSDGIRIASGAVIGAGAVVIDDIEESGVYVGVPARRIAATKEWLRAI